MTTPVTPRAITVAQLCDLAEVSDDAKGALRPEHAPQDLVAALVAGELFADAVRVMAHALPKREGVWWAWMCARRAASSPGAAEADALAATERWIAQPTEPNRRAAFDASQSATLETAAGCAALAAFLTSGSVAPPNVAAVPPPAFASAKAIAGGVTIAAVKTDPEHAPEKFRAFIQQSLDVAQRINLWGTAPHSA
ncbi:MAG: hypothetical protein ABJD07_05980 [Gemmatimonadaceae bacterium]